MSAYVTVQLEVTDAEAFGAYRERAGAALAKHGAKILSAGSAEVMHDADTGTAPMVLIEFPDADAAKGWLADPELQETHALRNRGAKATLTLMHPA